MTGPLGGVVSSDGPPLPIQPATRYLKGQLALAPDGVTVIQANVNMVTPWPGGYVAANWTALSSDTGVPGGSGGGGVTGPAIKAAGGVLQTDADAAYAPQWKASTAYTAGQAVVLPSGAVGTAKTSFTSTATFDASNWTVQTGTDGTAQAVAAGTPAWASNWFAALANRALAPAVVAVTGSSTVQGYVATQTPRRAVSKMSQQLQTRYNPAGVGGFHARALDTGWVTSSPNLVVLPGAIGRQAYTLANAATLTRTDTCTGFRLFYGQGPSAGTFTVSVDGTVVATITPDTSGNARADGVWTSAVLASGSHTLLITATSAGALIEGAIVYAGDNTTGVQVLVDGHAGASVADFTSSGPARLVQQGVGLYVLIPGATEYGANGTVAQFQSDLTALIAQRRAASALPCSFLIVGTFPRPDKGPAGWVPFLAAMKAVADASPADVGFVDLSAPFPTVNSGAGDPFNLLADGDIHLTDRGHQMLGDLLAAALIKAGTRAPGLLAGPSTAGVIGADTAAPTVTSFTATPGNAQNTLAWSGTDNVGITRWLLKTGSTTLYDGTATSYTHTGLTNGTAVSYTLQAFDAAGNASTTATATATPTSGSYDPTQISGLQAWYDPGAITGTADGAQVASWPDKSSNSYAATNTTASERPAYVAAASTMNNKPAVSFASAQRLVSALPAAGLPFTIIASFAQAGAGNRTILGSSASGGRQFRIGGSDSTQFFGALVNQGTAVIAQQGTPTVASKGVITVSYDGTTLVMRNNGTVVATSGPVASAFTGSPTSVIGGKDTATADAMNGLLGDIVVVARVMSTAEIQTEERRQGTKYAISVA